MAILLTEPLLYVKTIMCYNLLSDILQGRTEQHMFIVRALAEITGDSAVFITQPDGHEPDSSTVWTDTPYYYCSLI